MICGDFCAKDDPAKLRGVAALPCAPIGIRDDGPEPCGIRVAPADGVTPPVSAGRPIPPVMAEKGLPPCVGVAAPPLAPAGPVAPVPPPAVEPTMSDPALMVLTFRLVICGMVEAAAPATLGIPDGDAKDGVEGGSDASRTCGGQAGTCKGACWLPCMEPAGDVKDGMGVVQSHRGVAFDGSSLAVGREDRMVSVCRSILQVYGKIHSATGRMARYLPHLDAQRVTVYRRAQDEL